MECLADLAERYSFDEARVHFEQNMILPHVALDDVPAVWAELKKFGLATPNINLATDIIACPGLDYCTLANARAIPIAQAIAQRFADPAVAEDVGELRVKISGCINACGHHHVGHIGILGVDKKGEEFYQITLGGSGFEGARLGEILGPAVPGPKVADVVDSLVDAYRRERAPGESFVDTYRRVGLTPFKAAAYAEAH
jgi:sulfite reductase (NADPH) hemoprotein beta-component